MQTFAIDVETTGLGAHDAPPREDGVVEVAVAWRETPGSRVRCWHSLCDPGMRFCANKRAAPAFAVNGCTCEEIDHAPPTEVVADMLRHLLVDTHHDSVRLLAYKAAFDRSFLEAEPWRITSGLVEWVCVKEAVARRLGRTVSLVAACQELEVRVPTHGGRRGGFHTASTDAIATLLLHERLQDLAGQGAP